MRTGEVLNLERVSPLPEDWFWPTFGDGPKKYGKKFTMQMRAYDKAGNVRYSTKRAYHR